MNKDTIKNIVIFGLALAVGYLLHLHAQDAQQIAALKDSLAKCIAERDSFLYQLTHLPTNIPVVGPIIEATPGFISKVWHTITPW